MPIRHGGILASRCFNLATRPLLTQHDCTTAIEADDVEGVLADIDTDYGNCVVEIVGHSVLLVFGAPCQLRSLTGQEHGRTIPLPDFGTETQATLHTLNERKKVLLQTDIIIPRTSRGK